MTASALSEAESRATGKVIVIEDENEFDKLRDHGTVWVCDSYTAIATVINGQDLNFVYMEDG